MWPDPCPVFQLGWTKVTLPLPISPRAQGRLDRRYQYRERTTVTGLALMTSWSPEHLLRSWYFDPVAAYYLDSRLASVLMPMTPHSTDEHILVLQTCSGRLGLMRPMRPSPPDAAIGTSLDSRESNLAVCPSSAHRNSRLNQWRSVVGRILRLHQPSTVSSFLTLTPPHPSNLACLLLDATYHTGSAAVSGAKVLCCLLSKLELEDSGHRAC